MPALVHLGGSRRRDHWARSGRSFMQLQYYTTTPYYCTYYCSQKLPRWGDLCIFTMHTVNQVEMLSGWVVEWLQLETCISCMNNCNRIHISYLISLLRNEPPFSLPPSPDGSCGKIARATNYCKRIIPFIHLSYHSAGYGFQNPDQTQ
jgi:hypothetical protein